MQFLTRIKIWHKVLVIAFGFIIPIIITLYILVQGQNDSITYSYKELKATEYFVPVYKLLQQMQNHRAQALIVLLDPTSSNKERLNEITKEIDDIFNSLMAVNKQDDDELKTADALGQMHGKWKAIKELNIKTITPLASTQAHSEFTEGVILPFIHLVSNNSGISLDPLEDGYSIFDTLTRLVPAISEDLDNLRISGINIFEKGEAEKGVKAFASFFLIRAKTDLEALKVNNQWTFTAAPQLKNDLDPIANSFLSSGAEYITFFESQIGEKKAGAVMPYEYVDLATPTIDKLFDYVGATIKTLQSIFHARIQDAHYQKSVILLESGCMMFVAILFCFFVIREIKHVMSIVDDSSSYLVSSIGKIIGSTTNMSKEVTGTLNAITHVSGAINQVTDIAQVSLGNAQSVLVDADNAVDISNKGKGFTNDSIKAIYLIQEKMNSIEENMSTLTNLCRHISTIVKTSEDLGRQISILALNAVVASGNKRYEIFQVIAQSLTQLANESKIAIEPMRSILDQIQKAVTDASKSTNQCKDSINDGVKLCELVDQSFANLSEGIMKTKQSAYQIVCSNKQQFFEIEKIRSEIGEVKTAGTKNVEGIEELDLVTQTLSKVSTFLKQLMEQHRV